MSYYQVEEGPAEARDISADFQLYTPDRLRRTGERSDGIAVGPQTPAASGRRGPSGPSAPALSGPSWGSGSPWAGRPGLPDPLPFGSGLRASTPL